MSKFCYLNQQKSDVLSQPSTQFCGQLIFFSVDSNFNKKNYKGFHTNANGQNNVMVNLMRIWALTL